MRLTKPCKVRRKKLSVYIERSVDYCLMTRLHLPEMQCMSRLK